VTNMDPSIYSAGASNPFVSYFTGMFRENSSPYLPGTFITASEVNFLIAEAVVRGWVSGSAVDYFKQGIQTSLHQYDRSEEHTSVYNNLNHHIEQFNENQFV